MTSFAVGLGGSIRSLCGDCGGSRFKTKPERKKGRAEAEQSRETEQRMHASFFLSFFLFFFVSFPSLELVTDSPCVVPVPYVHV